MKEIKKLTRINNKLIKLPSSKSYLNRALIIASLTDEIVELTNAIDLGDDITLMINILSKLGIKIEHNMEKNFLIIHGQGGKFIKPKDEILNCGIAGTTTRFLIGLSMLFDFDIEITAEGRMLERPISDLINVMRELGAEIKYINKNECLPIKVLGKKNKTRDTTQIDGGKSSQFLTSILMISPLIGLKKIEVSNLVSKSYIDITLDVMKEFGVNIINLDYKIFQIQKIKYKRNTQYLIESDWSSASYFLALEHLHNIKLNISGLNYDSTQGDRRFLRILEQIKMHNAKEILILDMSLMPDISMTAMIICAFQNFTTKITGLKTLKDKECNRLEAMYNEFKKIRIKTEILDDWNSIVIHGSSSFAVNKVVEIETYHDHRIAMCFAILGTKTGNIFIQNSNVVKKSFPNFWQTLDSLYE